MRQNITHWWLAQSSNRKDRRQQLLHWELSWRGPGSTEQSAAQQGVYIFNLQVICHLVPFEIFSPSWRVHRGRGRGGCSRWRWRCRGRAPSWERKLYLGSHRTSAVFGIRANRWFNIKLIQFNIKLIQFNIKLIQFHPLPLQLKILGVRSDKNTVGWMVTNPPQTMTRFRQQNICWLNRSFNLRGQASL